MAGLPRLNINGLPGASAEEAAATNSPARGKEMRANLLSKLRPPPLVHAWDFWHDRQNLNKENNSDNSSSSEPAQQSQAESFANESDLSASARERLNTPRYEERLVHLAGVTDVRTFWEVFNNFDVTSLPLRDSVHLFHRGVKPVWEDPRNARGGSWTFRVPKERAQDFWKEICMLAIGERLQGAVQSERQTFIDDICGVSLSVRFTSILVQIWNRDASHEEGIAKIKQTVLDNLSPELRLKESAYYYKAHREHAGFNAGAAPSGKYGPNPVLTGEAPRVRVTKSSPIPAQVQDHQSDEVMPRPHDPPAIVHDHTTHSQQGESTRTEPTMPRSKEPRLMPVPQSSTDNQGEQQQELVSRVGPPGIKGLMQDGNSGVGREAAVAKGSGFVSQDETIVDIEESLRSMKTAMNKIEAKDEHIQKTPGQGVDTHMTGG